MFYPSTKQGDTLLTAEQARSRLGVSRTTLHKMVREGRLTPVRFGVRCTRYSNAELDGLVAAHRATVGA